MYPYLLLHHVFPINQLPFSPLVTSIPKVLISEVFRLNRHFPWRFDIGSNAVQGVIAVGSNRYFRFLFNSIRDSGVKGFIRDCGSVAGMPGDFIIRDVMINPVVSDRVMPGRSRGFGAAVNIAVVSGRAGSRAAEPVSCTVIYFVSDCLVPGGSFCWRPKSIR